MSSQEELHSLCQADPLRFWEQAASAVDWDAQWSSVLDSSQAPLYRWFVGGKLNSCYNAVDRHVKSGHGNRIALIYDSPVTGQKRQYTYADLLRHTGRLASVLSAMGLVKGDRVVIYMPLIPEAVFGMLACARLGAIHSVVFGGFAAPELAKRIDDAKPKLVLTATCGVEPTRIINYRGLLNDALNIAKHQVNKTLVYDRKMGNILLDLKQGRDYDWEDEFGKHHDIHPCISVEATDPLYILYTSGTTGMPKGVVRDNGGHAVALMWSMKYIFDAKPGERFFAASDIGWVVGHSFIVYGPLFQGCTTVLYEGKPTHPNAGSFWRLVQEYKIQNMFTAPTAIRGIRKEDPNGKLFKMHDLSTLRGLFLAGERCDPDTMTWISNMLPKSRVVDNYWQTETGYPITATCLGVQKVSRPRLGSAGHPISGYEVCSLDPNGKEVARGTMGELAIKLPLPPGTLQSLWNNKEGFIKSYLARFPGYYNLGDAGYVDKDGFVFIMARTDDVINVAGHRLSTGGMEEVVASHQAVAECAVVAVKDDLKGEKPLGLIVLKQGQTMGNQVVMAEIKELVWKSIGAFACFEEPIIVPKLPKTRSGKILRRIIRKIADGETYEVPSTIEDPDVLPDLEDAIIKSLMSRRAKL